MIPSIPTQYVESAIHKIRCDETFSSEPQGGPTISLNDPWEKMRQAFAKGQYAEALMNFENIQEVCDEKESAIEDLQNSLQSISKDVWKGKRPEYVEMCFLLKILEQKLGVNLIPPSDAIDENDKMSLFIAGRYQEALNLIENPLQIEEDLLFNIEYWFEDRFRQSSDIILHGAILSLTGKTEEALAWFENHPSDCYGYNQKTLLALTHFSQGN